MCTNYAQSLRCTRQIPTPEAPISKRITQMHENESWKDCRLLLLWILPDVLNYWINTNICTYYWGEWVVERLFREFSMAPKHQRIAAWTFFTGGTWTSVSSKNCSGIVSTKYNNWMHNIACMRYVLSYMQIHITRYGHNGMEWGAVANGHIRGLILMTLSMYFLEFVLSFHNTHDTVLRPLKECIIHSLTSCIHTFVRWCLWPRQLIYLIADQQWPISGNQVFIAPWIEKNLYRSQFVRSWERAATSLPYKNNTLHLSVPGTKSTSTFSWSTLNVARSGSMLTSLQINVIGSFKAIQRSFCKQESCHGGFPVLIWLIDKSTATRIGGAW